ncbi:MAG: hypothetical protein JSV91_15120 [Phycisphaerales bacterium]|nr:MAG: hypothetical protein JSV91_15120 [Phycisphaerales bacterium]
MRLFHWVILAIVAVNVIGAIVKGLAKTQQKERLEELAAQRRRAAMQQQQSPQRPGGASVPPAEAQQPGRYRVGRPTEALAERRREQLEQLRQRRRQRGETPPVQARVGRPASTLSAPPAAPPEPRPASLAEKMEQARRIEQRLQKRREAPPRSTAEQQRAQRQRAQQRKARLQRKAEAVVRPVEEVDERKAQRIQDRHLPYLRSPLTGTPAPERGAYDIARGGASPLVRSLRGRMRNPAVLRELYVIKELLDPPVSLRSGGI